MKFKVQKKKFKTNKVIGIDRSKNLHKIYNLYKSNKKTKEFSIKMKNIYNWNKEMKKFKMKTILF